MSHGAIWKRSILAEQIGPAKVPAWEEQGSQWAWRWGCNEEGSLSDVEGIRSPETSVEAAVPTQVVNGDCLYQGGSRVGLTRGYMLDDLWRKSHWGLMRDWLVRDMTEREERGTALICSRNGRTVSASTEIGNGSMWKFHQRSSFEHLKSQMPVR